MIALQQRSGDLDSRLRSVQQTLNASAPGASAFDVVNLSSQISSVRSQVSQLCFALQRGLSQVVFLTC